MWPAGLLWTVSLRKEHAIRGSYFSLCSCSAVTCPRAFFCEMLLTTDKWVGSQITVAMDSQDQSENWMGWKVQLQVLLAIKCCPPSTPSTSRQGERKTILGEWHILPLISIIQTESSFQSIYDSELKLWHLYSPTATISYLSDLFSPHIRSLRFGFFLLQQFCQKRAQQLNTVWVCYCASVWLSVFIILALLNPLRFTPSPVYPAVNDPHWLAGLSDTLEIKSLTWMCHSVSILTPKDHKHYGELKTIHRDGLVVSIGRIKISWNDCKKKKSIEIPSHTTDRSEPHWCSKSKYLEFHGC